MMNRNKYSIKFILFGLASSLLFGAATPASKALLQNFSPQNLAGLLYIGAALGVVPLILREKEIYLPWKSDKRTILLLLGAVLLGGILGPILLLMALLISTAGSVSLWLNLEFVATVILGHFLFREYLTLRGWIGSTFTLIAALILSEGESSTAISFLLVAAGCVCWGFDNHFTALIDGVSPAQTTFWKGVAAGGTNLIIGTTLTGGIGHVSLILAAIIVGAISYGLSITLYITSAQGLGATRGQILFSTAPFFGLLLSVNVLGEHFTISHAIASTLIVISLIIIFTEKHYHLHSHDYMFHQHLHSHDWLHHDHDHSNHCVQTDHMHWHEHKAFNHKHKHWPDIHHRHNHEYD